ncbi:alkaline phosphatase family protein [candidate division CSSED10-310 bacterium]|uniref:Alkaline phosphatase family protein n=1 Tax=candidate division CSSED10-310 bacterium TaxID=2855610 RepID=A0ABV6YYB9_UNCC1
MKKSFLIPVLMLMIFALLSCDSGQARLKVIVLGIDGLEPTAIDLLLSEGKLPNFARLRQGGAYGKLTTMEPKLSPIIWTTIATGRGPLDHGIGHFVAYRAKEKAGIPITSEMRKVQAIWNIVSEQQKKVGVVGWWGTWPAEPVNGHIVSDHTCYHFLFRQGEEGGQDVPGLTYPENLKTRIESSIRRPQDITYSEARPYLSLSEEEFNQPFDIHKDVSHFRWALATAESYRQIGLMLWRQEQPDLLMVYIEGTDTVSHLFGHLFRVQDLSGELANQQQKFGQNVEQMYLYADRLIGDFIKVMDSNTVLVVCSDHGFKLGELHEDPSKTRDMRRVSERYHTIKGVIYLYGKGIKKAVRLNDAHILDVTPTILSLFGLPQAKNMPGHVLQTALEHPGTTSFIETYETGTTVKSVTQPDANVSSAMVERLQALGYLTETNSMKGDRNMAALHFKAGKLKEAAEIYRRLARENPDDMATKASLAGVLGAMGNMNEAMILLDEVIKTEPLNVEAHHNKAVILEHLDQKNKAIETYRTALKYNPDYQPSRQALIRLTGSADVRVPLTEVHQKASVLAEKAQQKARKGDYTEAMKLLAQAESLAPDYILIYQYQSNTAYLMGDFTAAARALEKALKIEPDNALFQKNLQKIREKIKAEPPPPAN